MSKRSDKFINKKWRDLKMELKLIAYIIRKDHTFTSYINEDLFTIDLYKIFFKIIQSKQSILSKGILQSIAKKNTPSEDRKLIPTYLDKIYACAIKKIHHKQATVITDEMKKLYESRNIVLAVENIVDDLDEFDLDKTKEDLLHAVNSAQNMTSTAIQGDYLDGFDERYKKAEDFIKNPDIATGVLTGLKKFDKISGGIQNGELGIIMGESGTGKTLTLGNFGLSAWHKYHKNVVIFSLEMLKQQLEYRFDSKMARIPFTRFRKYNFEKGEMKRWRESINALKEQHDNFFEVVCLPRHTVPDKIKEILYRIQDIKKAEIDLCLIDYINLMYPNTMKGKEGAKNWGNQADVAYDLKALAVDFNGGKGLPIWSPNQMTDGDDENKKRGPIKLKHMKYSRGIGEVASIVIGLSRNEDDILEDKIILEIPKCRDFPPTEPISIHTDFEYMNLSKERMSFAEVAYKKKKVKKVKEMRKNKKKKKKVDKK